MKLQEAFAKRTYRRPDFPEKKRILLHLEDLVQGDDLEEWYQDRAEEISGWASVDRRATDELLDSIDSLLQPRGLRLVEMDDGSDQIVFAIAKPDEIQRYIARITQL